MHLPNYILIIPHFWHVVKLPLQFSESFYTSDDVIGVFEAVGSQVKHHIVGTNPLQFGAPVPLNHVTIRVRMGFVDKNHVPKGVAIINVVVQELVDFSPKARESDLVGHVGFDSLALCKQGAVLAVGFPLKPVVIWEESRGIVGMEIVANLTKLRNCGFVFPRKLAVRCLSGVCRKYIVAQFVLLFNPSVAVGVKVVPHIGNL